MVEPLPRAIPRNRSAEYCKRHGSGRLVRRRLTLVVDRRAITERGMATMRVIPTFQPIKDRHLRFGLGFEAPPAQHFALERGEKTFRHRVIVVVAHRTDRR